MAGTDIPGRTDPVIDALDGLVLALEANLEASQVAIRRASEIRSLRAEGLQFREIVDETGRPMVVQLISENLERLSERGAALRRAQAAVLHSEGLTMDQIARLFGVSRQRISAILKEATP